MAVAAGALVLGGCTNWLSVDNPGVIDQGALNPVADAPTLARSAQQNFASAYGHLIVYSSWFTGETDVSETFPTRNEFGRRDISVQNGSLDVDVWYLLSLSVVSSDVVLKIPLPDTTSKLTTQQMLDSAIAHFAKAISEGRGAGSDGPAMANASWVGTARAYLQAGNFALASAAADSVPAGFTYNLNFIDDLKQRFRLANRMWFYVRDRGSIAVAPTWRIGPQLPPNQVQNADPRVPWTVTTLYAPQDAQYSTDRGIPYAIQQKYPDYATPVRLASKIEADYIKAEAQGTAAQLAQVAARRTANGQPAYGGATDSNSVLTEFFTQRGLDFYLEGKRLGDFRRHPANIIGVPVPGSAYWKAGFAPVGNNTCYPLPITETDNNPNFH
jgi:hypothetical protein